MIERRKYLYRKEEVDGVKELDYLQTPIIEMRIKAVRRVRVTQSTQYRPDLLSKQVFDDYNYGWLLMDFNNILDPYDELTAGKILEIPSLSEYFNFFNTNANFSKKDK